mmetsp:Transcript_13114/g.32034  ORF Transcript_13114/g.32034 Transcript_13114/m.32034 type:complete len:924 (+) Transcript_13114:96-2867(+)
MVASAGVGLEDLLDHGKAVLGVWLATLMDRGGALLCSFLNPPASTHLVDRTSVLPLLADVAAYTLYTLAFLIALALSLFLGVSLYFGISVIASDDEQLCRRRARLFLRARSTCERKRLVGNWAVLLQYWLKMAWLGKLGQPLIFLVYCYRSRNDPTRGGRGAWYVLRGFAAECGVCLLAVGCAVGKYILAKTARASSPSSKAGGRRRCRGSAGAASPDDGGGNSACAGPEESLCPRGRVKAVHDSLRRTNQRPGETEAESTEAEQHPREVSGIKEQVDDNDNKEAEAGAEQEDQVVLSERALRHQVCVRVLATLQERKAALRKARAERQVQALKARVLAGRGSRSFAAPLVTAEQQEEQQQSTVDSGILVGVEGDEELQELPAEMKVEFEWRGVSFRDVSGEPLFDEVCRIAVPTVRGKTAADADFFKLRFLHELYSREELSSGSAIAKNDTNDADCPTADAKTASPPAAEEERSRAVLESYLARLTGGAGVTPASVGRSAQEQSAERRPRLFRRLLRTPVRTLHADDALDEAYASFTRNAPEASPAKSLSSCCATMETARNGFPSLVLRFGLFLRLCDYPEDADQIAAAGLQLGLREKLDWELYSYHYGMHSNAARDGNQTIKTAAASPCLGVVGRFKKARCEQAVAAGPVSTLEVWLDVAGSFRVLIDGEDAGNLRDLQPDLYTPAEEEDREYWTCCPEAVDGSLFNVKAAAGPPATTSAPEASRKLFWFPPKLGERGTVGEEQVRFVHAHHGIAEVQFEKQHVESILSFWGGLDQVEHRYFVGLTDEEFEKPDETDFAVLRAALGELRNPAGTCRCASNKMKLAAYSLPAYHDGLVCAVQEEGEEPGGEPLVVHVAFGERKELRNDEMRLRYLQTVLRLIDDLAAVEDRLEHAATEAERTRPPCSSRREIESPVASREVA